MENQVIPKEEIVIVKNKIERMNEEVAKIQVTNQDELKIVATHIANVKKMGKYVEQEMDKYIKPAKEIIKSAKDQYEPFIEMCEQAEKILKDKAQVFMIAEKKRTDEAKAKEIAKVESGYQKTETAVKKIEKIPEAPKAVKNEVGGTLRMKTVKVAKIVDEKLIPEEYYKPRELDIVKIKKVALAGIVIPGVQVVEESQMESR